MKTNQTYEQIIEAVRKALAGNGDKAVAALVAAGATAEAGIATLRAAEVEDLTADSLGDAKLTKLVAKAVIRTIAEQFAEDEPEKTKPESKGKKKMTMEEALAEYEPKAPQEHILAVFGKHSVPDSAWIVVSATTSKVNVAASLARLEDARRNTMPNWVIEEHIALSPGQALSAGQPENPVRVGKALTSEGYSQDCPAKWVEVNTAAQQILRLALEHDGLTINTAAKEMELFYKVEKIGSDREAERILAPLYPNAYAKFLSEPDNRPTLMIKPGGGEQVNTPFRGQPAGKK